MFQGGEVNKLFCKAEGVLRSLLTKPKGRGQQTSEHPPKLSKQFVD
jgi:hypothetical protein